MRHLSLTLPFFVLQLLFFPPLPPTCSHWLSPCPYLSPPSLLSPSLVFILFCWELCYDKDFTPRMYAVSACVMPLWGMGALASSASPTRPALPRQRGPGGGAGGGWRGWLLPTPCPILPGVDGNFTHTLTHARTHKQIEDSLIHPTRFLFFLFCSHGQLKMLTWNFLSQSIFLSHCYYLIHTSFRTGQDCLPSITKSWRAETFSWSHVRLDSRMV